jgi:hypothetical protein
MLIPSATAFDLAAQVITEVNGTALDGAGDQSGPTLD